jgi:hypothetical protein
VNQTIRKRVFETNSSSSHSLTVHAGDIVPAPLPAKVLRAGVLHLKRGHYGWEWRRFYTPIGKANYLLTQALRDVTTRAGCAEDVTRRLRDASAQAEQLCRVIEAHTGVRVLIDPRPGSVDHQSMGAGDHLHFEGDEALARFLFDANSFVQTGNDGSDPGKLIETDRGIEHYYQANYREPQPEWVPVEFELAPGGPHRLVAANSVDLGEPPYRELLEQVQAQATVTEARIHSTGYWNPHEHSDPQSSAMSTLRARGLCFSEHLVVHVHHEKRPPPDWSIQTTLVLRMPPELADALAAAFAGNATL